MVLIGIRTEASRTPALWLKPSYSTPCLRLSITGNFDIGIDMDGYELLLNRWYHIAYTLSDSEKRIYFYIDGKWVGSFSLKNAQKESIIFNDGPLYIGDHLRWNGITGKISNSISVSCQKQEKRAYRELITEPVKFNYIDGRVINHLVLPVVKDELSITLKIKLSTLRFDFCNVFYKGRWDDKTPALLLKSSNSTLCLRLSITGNSDAGIDMDGYGLLLNQWYHIVYTLSDSEKRISFYIDGKWVGSFSLKNIQNQSIRFNDGPLYIGYSPGWYGFIGDISTHKNSIDILKKEINELLELLQTIELDWYLTLHEKTIKSYDFSQVLLFNYNDFNFKQITRVNKETFWHIENLIHNNSVFLNQFKCLQKPVWLQLVVTLERLGCNGNGASVG
ncbi:15209_t:CDS:2 [Cetraspora pellucida]|uniref:15209_t:CDS:1 n=1 Tax=Cetraspora pellucida TaxID=1433469 RepID=A0ACA9K8E8_9GLOM|nr:15209_t:CDS:2 [Cetraspora pellucida]